MDWNFDIRYRFQARDDASVSNYISNSNSLRARLSLDMQPDDDFLVHVRFSTGLGAASNIEQPLGKDGDLGTKSFGLDRASIQWQPNAHWAVTAGKFKNALHKPGASQLQWDNDYNPEGFAISYRIKIGEQSELKWTAINYLLDTTTDESTFPVLYGLQATFSQDFKTFKYTLNAEGLQYLDLDSRPVYGNIGTNTQSGDAYVVDYNIVGGGIDITYFGLPLPLLVYGDYAHNSILRENSTAHEAGVKYGDLANNYEWQFFAAYKEVGKDAFLDLFSEGAFMGGGTDNRGTVFGIGYQTTDNTTLQFNYFKGERYIAQGDASPTTDFEQLQTMFTVKY
tara:strand:- start:145078 stop:146091 length:1014 start_codon:yes stop_codon:yes gene_type:complete